MRQLPRYGEETEVGSALQPVRCKEYSARRLDSSCLCHVSNTTVTGFTDAVRLLLALTAIPHSVTTSGPDTRRVFQKPKRFKASFTAAPNPPYASLL